MGLQVVAVACDWGAGQPGGVGGVQAWYALGLHYKHLAWIEAQHTWIAPDSLWPAWIGAGNHVYANRIEPWRDFAEKLQRHLRQLPLEDKVLFLTGDHSWAGVILPVLAEKIQRIGLIWLDAHADFHNPATTPSGNLHGMTLAMVTGLNTHRYHPVPQATWQLWEKLVRPVIAAENLILIGLRSYEPPEMEVIQSHGIVHFLARSVIEAGIQPILQAAQSLAERVDALYVSLDVDVWDPSFARGTSSPAPGGLSIAQVRTLLEEMLSWERVQFVEVTEINPLLDRDNQTAVYAYGTVRPFIDGKSGGKPAIME